MTTIHEIFGPRGFRRDDFATYYLDTFSRHELVAYGESGLARATMSTASGHGDLTVYEYIVGSDTAHSIYDVSESVAQTRLVDDIILDELAFDPAHEAVVDAYRSARYDIDRLYDLGRAMSAALDITAGIVDDKCCDINRMRIDHEELMREGRVLIAAERERCKVKWEAAFAPGDLGRHYWDLGEASLT